MNCGLLWGAIPGWFDDNDDDCNFRWRVTMSDDDNYNHDGDDIDDIECASKIKGDWRGLLIFKKWDDLGLPRLMPVPVTYDDENDDEDDDVDDDVKYILYIWALKADGW